MVDLTASLLLLVLISVCFLLGQSIARHTGLQHTLKASLTAALIGVSLESVLAAVMWAVLIMQVERGALVLVANVALVLQAPGLLLSNMVGFGFHSEGEKLKLFYLLMGVANAVIYSFTFFVFDAFRHRKNRAKV
jgi:hypothetical protein